MSEVTPAAPAAPTGSSEAQTQSSSVVAPTNPSGAAGAQAQAASQPAVDWTTGLNDEMKGFVQNKGFKDPAAALDSYRNLEKLLGAPKERLLKLPEKDDDPAWAEIQTRLGKPAKPEEYKIAGENPDPEFTKWAQNTFHELGLSKKAAEGLSGKFNEYSKALQTKMQGDQQAKAVESVASLKKEWGAAHDQNLGIAKRAAAEFGVTADVIDSMEKQMGFAKVMKHFHAIGTKLGEDSFVSDSSQSKQFGAMTPGQAQARITQLKSDKEFTTKYINGNADAKAEMERLHRMMNPE